LLNLDWDLVKFLFRTVVASFGMGVISWLSLHLLNGSFDSGGTIVRLAVTATLMAISAAIYLFLARLLKLGEARQIWITVRDLLPGGNRGPQ
ncbi:MAG TPA: hypothetical protein VIK39_06155, partial [Candidatus Angelobacter sp.]